MKIKKSDEIRIKYSKLTCENDNIPYKSIHKHKIHQSKLTDKNIQQKIQSNIK